MRVTRCMLAIGILSLLATAARADEIIYFTNGTYMKILAHELKGDMLKVVMDGNGSMGFPTKMVDKIESGGGIVYGGPAGAGSIFPNQMAPGLQSELVVGARSAAARDADPDIMARRAQASRMQPTELLSGRQAQAQFDDGKIMSNSAPGPSGTQRMGNHLVVGSAFSGHSLPFKPGKLQIKPEAAPPPSADR